jgi:dTDP-4-dehydrorhamnose 3,5-epimerase
MKRFRIETTGLEGLLRIQRQPLEDSRGWFERLYCDEELLAATGEPLVPRQINRSRTQTRGAVRGLHFQRPPHAETKLVCCLRGEAFDVAVDLRAGSPTFLRWYGTRLSEENRESLWIPKGFAHGFQVLAGPCELLYLHSAAHAPQAEGGLHVAEPRIGIRWPLPIADLSARDSSFAPLDGTFGGLRV